MADLPSFPRDVLASAFNGNQRMILDFEEVINRLVTLIEAAQSAGIVQDAMTAAEFVVAAPSVALEAAKVLTEGRGITIAQDTGIVTISHPVAVEGGEATFIVTGDTNLILPLIGTVATLADIAAAVSGLGTVSSVSVVTANGVSGSVATATTTPAITLTLGAITPSSVAASGTVTGSNLSGTNTGDQTITLTGDATGSGTSSFAVTLANVNSNVGSFGSATQVPQVTVNGKGLVTAVANVTITPAASSITGGAALTKADDTNVTLTLGGTPASALLAAASLTLGWTGILSAARGGTANAFFAVSGPASATKTFTFPNASDAVACLGQVNAFTQRMTVTNSVAGQSAFIASSSSGCRIVVDLSGGGSHLYDATNHLFRPIGGASNWLQISAAAANFTVDIQRSGSKVIGTRKTGWAVATGTATRTTFDTATVTLPQLAERVKALIDDLHATAGHGLIGT